ncbi:MAG: response regulator, partial [Treponema sp.]|nr:response regulator [Treponema sp.]
NRKILSIVLQRYGATVLEAKNGKEAVKIIKEHPEISIVFMDIQMPEMDGTTATKEVRKINYNGVIIACTANNDENDFEGYRKLGMNDILVKPFNKLAVKTLLEKWYAVIELPESRNVTLLDNHSGEVWNKEYFDEIISGDIKIGFELLEEYKKQTKMVLEKLPLLASESNFDEIRRCAHLLNGSSSSIGAVKLSEKSKEISFFAKKKDVSGIKKIIEKIKTEFNAFEVLTDRWKSQNKISK